MPHSGHCCRQPRGSQQLGSRRSSGLAQAKHHEAGQKPAIIAELGSPISSGNLSKNLTVLSMSARTHALCTKVLASSSRVTCAGKFYTRTVAGASFANIVLILSADSVLARSLLGKITGIINSRCRHDAPED
jgi:hypothetical protein